MKKIFIALTFVLFSVLSFAAFNDNLNLLKEEDRKNIEEKIDSISNMKKITIFVNTLSADEGFAISDPEHALIINLKKVENAKKYEVEISFSKDIDIEDYRSEIEEVLTESETILKQEEYAKYLVTVLDGLGTILENVEIEPLNQMTMTKEQETTGNNIALLSFIVILIVAIITFIIFKLNKIDSKNSDR